LRGHGRREWPAALLAQRFRDPLEGLKANFANWDAAGVRERLKANAARSREKHGGKCVERVSNDHRCVVNDEGIETLLYIGRKGKREFSRTEDCASRRKFGVRSF
jgi:hypothetical protein